MPNLGNVAGVVISPVPPLEADGVTEKRYVLWARPIANNSYDITAYYGPQDSWLPIGAFGVIDDDENVPSLVKTFSKTKILSLLSGVIGSSDIIDNLTTDDATKALAASQGVIIKAQLDAINNLLTSDNINLDELQEVVDFIEANRDDLDNLAVSNIAGLQAIIDGLNSAIAANVTALDTKVDKVAGKGLSEEDYTTAEKAKVADNSVNLQTEITDATGSFTVTDAQFRQTFFINTTGAITITFPIDILRDGWVCFFAVKGTGQLTVAVEATGTLTAPDGVLLSQGNRGMVEKELATNTFHVSGEWE